MSFRGIFTFKKLLNCSGFNFTSVDRIYFLPVQLSSFNFHLAFSVLFLNTK